MASAPRSARRRLAVRATIQFVVMLLLSRLFLAATLSGELLDWSDGSGWISAVGFAVIGTGIFLYGSRGTDGGRTRRSRRSSKGQR